MNYHQLFFSKKAIIWDWNGTLLNDTDICIFCMNILLSRRKIPTLSKEKYRRIFTFPVRDYYEKAGFNFSIEAFEVPATEFIEHYHQNLRKAGLFPEVYRILQDFQSKGYYQSILSAMQHDSLISSLTDTGIIKYFDAISGINNHYAHSKLDIGKELLEKMRFRNAEVLLIGDSIHDLEVSTELGIDCLLIANGHQSKERLLNKTSVVLDELKEISEFL